MSRNRSGFLPRGLRSWPSPSKAQGPRNQSKQSPRQQQFSPVMTRVCVAFSRPGALLSNTLPSVKNSSKQAIKESNRGSKAARNFAGCEGYSRRYRHQQPVQVHGKPPEGPCGKRFSFAWCWMIQLGSRLTSLLASVYAGQRMIKGPPPLAARGWGASAIC